MLFILTGNGKGKTTSAIGMGLRAIGAGRKVLMIQFLKTGQSSELKVIKKIANFEVKSFGQKGFLLPDKTPSKKDIELAEQAFQTAQEALNKKEFDFLILDEINLALYLKLLKIKDVLAFLKKHKSKTDIVLTGRHCLQTIINLADLVTEFKEKKHYLQKGQRAIKGIEY